MDSTKEKGLALGGASSTGTATKSAAKRASKSAGHPASRPETKTIKVTAKRIAAKKAAVAAKPKAAVAEESATKAGKAKLVRDSFTMPRVDFDLIGKLKDRALGFKRPAKKSELLRAGLQALDGLSDAKLQAMLEGLLPLKAGRPKKQDA